MLEEVTQQQSTDSQNARQDLTTGHAGQGPGSRKKRKRRRGVSVQPPLSREVMTMRRDRLYTGLSRSDIGRLRYLAAIGYASSARDPAMPSDNFTPVGSLVALEVHTECIGHNRFAPVLKAWKMGVDDGRLVIGGSGRCIMARVLTERVTEHTCQWDDLIAQGYDLDAARYSVMTTLRDVEDPHSAIRDHRVLLDRVEDRFFFASPLVPRLVYMFDTPEEALGSLVLGPRPPGSRIDREVFDYLRYHDVDTARATYTTAWARDIGIQSLRGGVEAVELARAAAAALGDDEWDVLCLAVFRDRLKVHGRGVMVPAEHVGADVRTRAIPMLDLTGLRGRRLLNGRQYRSMAHDEWDEVREPGRSRIGVWQMGQPDEVGLVGAIGGVSYDFSVRGNDAWVR